MAVDRFKARTTLPGIAVLLLVVVNAVLVFLVFSQGNGQGSGVSGDDVGGRLIKQPGEKAGPSPTDTPSTRDGGSRGRGKQVIRLRAQSDTDKRFHALRLSGRYPRANGPVTLHVQERVKHRWITYPLPAVSDSSGRFQTFVSLARLGLARIRVVNPRTGLASPVLSIRVTS